MRKFIRYIKEDNMLLQFNFKNFRSFKDNNTVDLRATKITESNEQMIEFNNIKVLPIAAFFGANASGKSNVFNAFNFMRTLVLRSFEFGGSSKEEDSSIWYDMNNIQFAFGNNSKDLSSEFEVVFTKKFNDKDYIFDYGFVIDHKYLIKEEWLKSKSPTAKKFKEIFVRKEDVLNMSGLTKEYSNMITLTLEKEVLILSLGSKLKLDICKIVKEWFEEIFCLNYSGGLNELFTSERSPKQFENEDIQKNILNYLSSFDESIKGFRKISKDKKTYSNYPVTALHDSIENDKQFELTLDDESAGTKKMISLYTPLSEAIKKGGVIIVDELNSRLHPLLVRNIIRTFADKKTNPNGAQLLFTTHDTFHLNDGILRRDEIWFVEKSNQGVSSLYSLVDFECNGTKVRKDADLEKNYLLGRYGAIPELKPLNLI